MKPKLTESARAALSLELLSLTTWITRLSTESIPVESVRQDAALLRCGVIVDALARPPVAARKRAKGRR
jgi:hypothetical protein